MVDMSIEEDERVAALPSFEVLLEVADHEMTRDGRDGEIDPAVVWWHSIREVVVLDPSRMTGISLQIESARVVERGRASSPS